MDDAGASVLLVGNCARKSSALGRHLLKRGCKLSLAAGKKEAIEVLQHRRFDVVLCGFLLPDGSAYELMTPLRNTDTTMFFSFAVEDSCWWITAMLQGQDRSEEAGCGRGSSRWFWTKYCRKNPQKVIHKYCQRESEGGLRE